MIATEPIQQQEPLNSVTKSSTTMTGTPHGVNAPQNDDDGDEFYHRLKTEALRVLHDEPEMERLLRRTVLAPHVASFEDAVIQTLCHRLLLPSATPLHYSSAEEEESENERYPMSPQGLRKLVHLCMDSDMKENGWTFPEAIRKDAMAVVERDPAMESILEVVLFAKG
jgi:Serine acetyltransferase, N-terminal